MVIIATLISAILIIVVVLQFKEKRRVKKERDTQRRKEQRREMIMKTVAGLSAVMMKANTVRTKSQIEIVKNYLDRKMNSTYAKQTIEVWQQSTASKHAHVYQHLWKGNM